MKISGFPASGRLKKLLCLLLPGLLLVSLTSSCSDRKEKIFRKSRILMDTLVTISVVADSGEKAEKAMERAFDEIASLDGTLNFFSGRSEVSLINRNAGVSPVEVSPSTIDLLTKALSASEKTEGAFDATIGPEIALWDFAAGRMPDDKTVRARLPLVNYKRLRVDRERSTAYLSERGMSIDLGAIAKGYAADRAVEELKELGIGAGLVSVAGDIKGFGLKPDGGAWKIGIRNPRATGADDIMATIELRDEAVSTSGDYERYFIKDGKRYHHILDPGTGYPSPWCRSVTVIAKDGVDADSFSTAVFVMGPERGMDVLRTMGFEGVIVDREGKVHVTPALRDRIEFQRNH